MSHHHHHYLLLAAPAASRAPPCPLTWLSRAGRRVRQVRGAVLCVPGQVRVTGVLSLTCQRGVSPRPRLTFICHLPATSQYFFLCVHVGLAKSFSISNWNLNCLLFIMDDKRLSPTSYNLTKSNVYLSALPPRTLSILLSFSLSYSMLKLTPIVILLGTGQFMESQQTGVARPSELSPSLTSIFTRNNGTRTLKHL